MVDVVVGVELFILSWVAGDGGFEVAVGDAGRHQGKEAGEVGGIAEDAPGVVRAGVGFDRFRQRDGAG